MPLIAAGFHVGELSVQFPRNTQRQGIIALECCNMGTDPSCCTQQCPALLQGASVLPFTFLWAACPCHLRKLITGPEEEPEFFFFQLIFLCMHRSGTSMVTFKACFWSNSSSWAFRETFSLCPKPKHWKQTTERGREPGMTQFAYPRMQFVLGCVTSARCLPNLSQRGSSSDVGSLLPSWTPSAGGEISLVTGEASDASSYLLWPFLTVIYTSVNKGSYHFCPAFTLDE